MWNAYSLVYVIKVYQVVTFLQPMASMARQRFVYLVQVPSHWPYAKFLALPCLYSFALCEQLHFKQFRLSYHPKMGHYALLLSPSVKSDIQHWDDVHLSSLINI